MPEKRVRLTEDLTKYHPGLVAGSEGYTTGQLGEWSKHYDRFVNVCFPGKTTLDVLWRGLEVIGDYYGSEGQTAIDQCAKIVEGYLAAYPADIFLPPEPGHHGQTVDACSAAALRAILPNIITDIRALKG